MYTNTTVSWELIQPQFLYTALSEQFFASFYFNLLRGNDPSSGKAASKENQREKLERSSFSRILRGDNYVR